MELPLCVSWWARRASRYLRGDEVPIPRRPAGSSQLPNLSSRNRMLFQSFPVMGRAWNNPREWGNYSVGSYQSSRNRRARAFDGHVVPTPIASRLGTTWLPRARRFRWIAGGKQREDSKHGMDLKGPCNTSPLRHEMVSRGYFVNTCLAVGACTFLRHL